jgi:hypothetical protein
VERLRRQKVQFGLSAASNFISLCFLSTGIVIQTVREIACGCAFLQAFFVSTVCGSEMWAVEAC